VVLALPEDMLFSQAAVADVAKHHVVRPAPSPSQMRELERLLQKAKAPFVLVGGGGWTREASKSLQAWAEANGLPVGNSFRCQDLLDNRSPSYVGDVGIGLNPKLAERVKNADVLLVIGARLGEMTTSAYTLIEAPQPRQALVHVHAGAEELGRVYRPELPINSGTPQFVDALQNLNFKNEAWKTSTAEARADYLAWREPRPMPGKLHYGEAIRWLSEHLPEDTIVAGGAGNFAGWLHRHFQYKGFRTQLGSTAGSMGYGYPAAVAAKLSAPERNVLAVCGDGDFLMNGQEIATAAQYGANFVALVVNNGLYGTIRMHQEREYPGRVYGTGLRNPDFAAYARAFGGHGETVEKTEDFAPAFERASRAGKPAIVELKIDPDAITPAITLSAIREKALKAR
jgi:acetolactate synthase-1/2/3 large subunit